MADRGHIIDGPDGPEGIAGLQARLDELRDSVELLRTQGVWNRGPTPEPIPAPQPTVILPPSYDAAEPYPPTLPPIPPEPAAPEAAVPPPVPGPPIPASGAATTVAHVDAGPFADLIELRHFEDDLESLTAVEEVRVRRFGHGRADIEVGMTGPYDLALELPRLGLPMDLTAGADGELRVEFAPPAADAATGEPASGPDRDEAGPAADSADSADRAGKETAA